MELILCWRKCDKSVNLKECIVNGSEEKTRSSQSLVKLSCITCRSWCGRDWLRNNCHSSKNESEGVYMSVFHIHVLTMSRCAHNCWRHGCLYACRVRKEWSFKELRVLHNIFLTRIWKAFKSPVTELGGPLTKRPGLICEICCRQGASWINARF